MQFQLLFYSLMLLQTETDGVPSRHDVVGDDAAQRVRHDGHFASSLLKLGVPGAEKHVQSIQLLCQAPGDLEMKTVFHEDGMSPEEPFWRIRTRTSSR